MSDFYYISEIIITGKIEYEKKYVQELIWISDKSNFFDNNQLIFNYTSINLTYNSQMNEEYLCPKCKRAFTEQDPPKKLINCSHNLCNKCLNDKDQLICPIDNKRLEKRKYLIDAFKVNYQLLQAINLSNNSQSQVVETKGKNNHPSGQSSSRSKGKNQFTTPIVNKCSSIDVSKSKNQEKETVLVELPCLSPQKKSENNSNRLTISPKDVKIRFDTCLLHSKKADLVCLECRCLICSNCGLFGQHKLHKILPYDSFLSQYSTVTEQSFRIYEQLKQREQKLNEEAISLHIDEALKQKRDSEVKNIKLAIAGYIDFFKKLERQLIIDLDLAVGYKKKKLMQSASMEELLHKKQRYIAQIQKMSNGVDDIFNLDNIGQYIDYIDKESPNSYIINEGQYLLVQIDNAYRQKIQIIAQESRDVNFEFAINTDQLRDSVQMHSKDVVQINSLIEENKKKLIQKPNPYYKNGNTPIRALAMHHPQSSSIKTQIKMSPNVNINNQDDPLLIGTNSKSGSKGSQGKLIKENSPVQPYTTFQFQISGKKVSQAKGSLLTVNEFNPSLSRSKRTLHASKKSQLQQSRVNSKSKSKSIHNASVNVLAQKSDNLRRKKLDIPQKYMRLYEDLQKDKLQVLDLGGAFLGEGLILSISELFASRGKLRSAKLMNNKISDDIFVELVSRCRNLTSLNLSYNLLTQKSLDWLQHEAGYLGQLKNITLSNNKIVLRNVRDRLQGLARRGINVSL